MYIHKLPNAAASTISVTTAAQTLYALIDTAASTAANLVGKLNAVDIVVEGGDVRVLFDGNAPTSSEGVLLSSGTIYTFRGVPLTKMQLIATGASPVICSIQVGMSDDSENTSAAGTATASASEGGAPVSGVLQAGGLAEDPTAAAAVTEGTINTLITDLAARLLTSMGTQLAGEDLTEDVIKVEERFSYQEIVAVDTQVKAEAGFLHTITISCDDAAPTAGSIIIYDNTAESGTELFNHTFTTTPFVPFTVTLDVVFGTGLYIGFTTTADVNVTLSYR